MSTFASYWPCCFVTGEAWVWLGDHKGLLRAVCRGHTPQWMKWRVTEPTEWSWGAKEPEGWSWGVKKITLSGLGQPLKLKIWWKACQVSTGRYTDWPKRREEEPEEVPHLPVVADPATVFYILAYVNKCSSERYTYYNFCLHNVRYLIEYFLPKQNVGGPRGFCRYKMFFPIKILCD